jgi:hypothetical protein
MGEEVTGMTHPVYKSERSPCFFFLFGYLKNKFIDKQFATPEELFSEVETTISGRPSDMISWVFAT